MNIRLQQKSGADLRRMQLVDIASDLVCNEGVDALKHSTVAELAGCTRALVYRYFPKKSDIYIAISESFYDELDALMSVEEQQVTVSSSAEGSAGSRRFFSLLFDALEQRGLAAFLLPNNPTPDHELKTYISDMQQRFEKRWTDAFELRNIKGVHAELVMVNSMSVVTNYFEAYSRGRIERETAIAQIERAVYTFIDMASTS